MAVTWTTPSMVKARIHSQTPMADVDINELIEQNEHFWTILMKSYGKFGIGGGTFDATKHRFLRDACTSRTALMVLCATSLSWQTLEQAAMDADLLYQQVIGFMNMLADQDYVSYLKGL